MEMKSAKLAFVSLVILIVASMINPAILDDKIMRSQTMIKNVAGQEIEVEWDQMYGGTGSEGASALIQTSEGGYAISGSTSSYGAGEEDMWLVKTDADGTVEWDKTYGGTGSEGANALIQTSDGGYAISGPTSSYGAGGRDMWLVKTDADGIMEWDQTYGGTDDESVNALIQTSDGGFALTGSTYSYGEDGRDMWLVKTDADGIMEWDQTYGDSEEDEAYALLQTIDGGFILAGSTYSYRSDPLGDEDMWLVKTDADGTVEWDQTYGGTGDDRAYALIQTTDGGFALAGSRYFDRSYRSTEFGEFDMWLVKTNADGTAEWNQTYGGTGLEWANALIQTSDGGFALAGGTFSTSYISIEEDMLLVRTDLDGIMEWNQTYGGSDHEWASALIQTSDGGFAMAGYTRLYGTAEIDMWLVKVRPIENTKSDDGNGFLDTGNFPGLIAMFVLIYAYRIKKRNHIMK